MYAFGIQMLKWVMSYLWMEEWCSLKSLKRLDQTLSVAVLILACCCHGLILLSGVMVV